VTEDDSHISGKTVKDILRKLIPESLLKQRNIVLRLGPSGRTYASLRMLDAIGIRSPHQRRPPASARSFLFVCFGNIMRSAIAEVLMRRALSEAGLAQQVVVMSAGLHATPGTEAHPWAQQAAAELGVSLGDHRAELVTQEMVTQADCVFAMDFQNKAELLTLYPDSQKKIYMLSAYAEGPLKFREIRDPYLEDLEATRLCGRQLQTCVRNLLTSIFPASAEAIKKNSHAEESASPLP
jgi:protein-tyrosine-phosphatase